MTWLIAGSIFTTRPFSALATQTASLGEDDRRRRQRGRDAAQDLPVRWGRRAPSPARARPRPSRPRRRCLVGLAARSPRIGTENVFTIRPVVPSRRTSPGPSSSVTQAAPPPVAMPPGENGSLVDESTLRDARSTRATRRSSPSSTHAWRASNATSHGWLANGRRATTLCETRVDQAHRLRCDRESRCRRASASAAVVAEDDAAHDGRGRDGRHGQRAQRRGGAGTGAARQLATQSGLARRGQLAAAREAVVRRLRERFRDDGVEAAGNARPHVARARGRLVHVRVHGRDLALALERRLPGEALEEHAPERVDVCPRVDRPALDLLGRDVRDRADERPLRRSGC